MSGAEATSESSFMRLGSPSRTALSLGRSDGFMLRHPGVDPPKPVPPGLSSAPGWT